MPRISGGCLCRAIRYESDAQPAMVAVCHCSSCQKNTGSAFSLNLGMPKGSVSITGDSLATYEDRAGSSGNWCVDKQPWVSIEEGAARLAGNPG